MAKIRNISPKASYQILPAADELVTNYVAGSIPFGDSAGGLQMFSQSFKRGYGDKVFGSDSNGIWLGAADFDNAPFKVDMEGNVSASTLDLSQYVSKTDNDQTLSGEIQVGSGNVLIDGPNKRIMVNDGTYDRCLFGYQSGGF